MTNIAGISLLQAAGLIAGCAAILVVLHLLRVRPRPVSVVTTLFWSQAAQQSRARMLLHRFRHLGTFLLALLLCSLIILAWMRPQWSGDTADGRYRVVIVDTGLSMGAVDAGGQSRFDLAGERAVELVSAAGKTPAAVIAAGPPPRLVHGFDEPAVLAKRQLAAVSAGAAPVVMVDALALARSLLAGRDDGQIIVVSDHREPAWGEDVEVVTVGTAGTDAGVLGALFEPDPRDPFRGTLRVRVGAWATQPVTVAVSISAEDDAVLLTDTLALDSGATAEVTLPGVPAQGQRLVVQLQTADDALAGDDRLVFTVPARQPIAVALRGTVPPALRKVLENDPAVVLTDHGERCDVLVCPPAHAETRPKPAMVLVGEGAALAGDMPVMVLSGNVLTAQVDFGDALPGAGPVVEIAAEDGVQLTPLLTVADDAVALSWQSGARRRVYLSTALAAADSVTHTRPAFAMFVSGAIRHLGGWSELPLVLTAEHVAQDPLWADAAPAGAQVLPGARSAAARVMAPTEESALVTDGNDGVGRPGYVWLLLLAVVVLMIDIALHLRGRIS